MMEIKTLKVLKPQKLIVCFFFQGISYMAIGTLGRFNDAKGFGLIVPGDGGEDLFTHISTINMGGFKSLNESLKVCYEVTQSLKGKQPSLIQVIYLQLLHQLKMLAGGTYGYYRY